MNTTSEPHTAPETDVPTGGLDWLGDRARADSAAWGQPVPSRQVKPDAGWKASARALRGALGGESVDTTRRRWMAENRRLVKTALANTGRGLRGMRQLLEIELNGRRIKRIAAAAESFLVATGFEFDASHVQAYFGAAQGPSSLTLGELAALRCAIEWVLLQRVELWLRTGEPADEAERLAACLRTAGETPWSELAEELSGIHRVLQDDPDGVYAAMDRDSRDFYRRRIADLAERSGWSEEAIAREAVHLAQAATGRRAHVGYYLLDKGRGQLEKTIHFRIPAAEAMRRVVLRHPTLVYLGATLMATLAIIGFVLAGVRLLDGWWLAALLTVLPASQAAVMMVNRVATRLFPPRVLPKLDFSPGMPVEATTLVVVPSLLFDGAQVRSLIWDLEIRHAGNRDPNLYFALLTDSPDAAQQFDHRDELVGLCARLIKELNERHGTDGRGPFLLFHRHRVYSESERTWMGWERKRGKLLDLNNLLQNRFDSFPVKEGNLSALPKIRYVITLDADTQLPPDAGHRLAGTIAHPLNRAVVDPATKTVTEGYGIIQPRIGISIDSAAKSYLAAIFSGETGFDIYSRAVSEVYQDLFGEATFTGKGIYEVSTFQEVLVERFPNDALLSHDLIEGAYARAGLASEIELIDDYPTRFSAYCRRKHRWVRGDWQTVLWLLPWVPDYHGCWVRNPVSPLSQWKIIDNLRRSLIDVSLFAMLLCGWLWLPAGAATWTIAALVVLVLPSYFSLLVSVIELPFQLDRRTALLNAWDSFLTEQVNLVFTIAFIGHQTLVTLDAVGRTALRMVATRRKLLEWETAAEAEMGTRKRTPVDRYLDWTLWLALAVLGVLAVTRPQAIGGALLVLVAWVGLKPLCRWLDRPVPIPRTVLDESGLAFLRASALRTWRYFRDMSGPAENWLIPDNVQEAPEKVAHRISPTNLGLLVNARLAAWELGFTSLSELISETESTFRTMRRLERWHGHFLNWYDTRSLQRLEPLFVSTVDSGNLAASLWTIGRAFAGIARRPLFDSARSGMAEHAKQLREVAGNENVPAAALEAVDEIDRIIDNALDNPARLVALRPLIAQLRDALEESSEARYWAVELGLRAHRLAEAMGTLAPWTLPENDRVVQSLGIDFTVDLRSLTLGSIIKTAARLRTEIEAWLPGVSGEASAAARRLLDELTHAGESAKQFAARLETLAAEAQQFVAEMDFGPLYNRRRKLLSVGWDLQADRLGASCYDLLASEARTAHFIALAKGEVPLESWFHLGRAHVISHRQPALLSWTGTMFEYLMPFLWMRCYPNTLLGRAATGAVRVQQLTAAAKRLPWGVSEAARARQNDGGDYMYGPVGIPALSLSPAAEEDDSFFLVSPYSTFLSLPIDAAGALANLRRLKTLGCHGRFGFYEAVEFSGGDTGIVRSWMAHHQGMSLVAACNALTGGIMRQHFHNNPAVAATELVLQERMHLVVNCL